MVVALAWCGGEAAIDYEHLAGDVGGIWRGEECDCVGDFMGLTEAAHGDAFQAGFTNRLGDG